MYHASQLYHTCSLTLNCRKQQIGEKANGKTEALQQTIIHHFSL